MIWHAETIRQTRWPTFRTPSRASAPPHPELMAHNSSGERMVSAVRCVAHVRTYFGCVRSDCLCLCGDGRTNETIGHRSAAPRSHIFRRQWRPALDALGDAPMTTDTIYYCGRTTSVHALCVCCPCVNRDSPSAHNGLAPADCGWRSHYTSSAASTACTQRTYEHGHTYTPLTHIVLRLQNVRTNNCEQLLAGSRNVHAKCCVHITRSLCSSTRQPPPPTAATLWRDPAASHEIRSSFFT